MTNRTIAVIGGGITGLSGAHELEKGGSGTRVILLEASHRLGGMLRTETFCGTQVEAGADSFLDREPWALDLCDEVGISAELVAPGVFGGLVWDGERLQPLPAGTVMGFPVSAGAALRARTLSLSGRLRALGGLVLPGPLEGPDVSVGRFVRRRFGPQLLDRIVDPILAGTRAGHPDDLSLAAALPQIDRWARSHRSLMRGPSAGAPARFLAPRKGMSDLIEKVSAGLARTEIFTGTEARRLRPSGGSYEIELKGGSTIPADGILLALPAGSASGLLAELAPAAAEELAKIRHAPVAVVSLAFQAGALKLPGGSSGVLVPSRHVRTISAATWWSEKWPHTRRGDEVVVRCFVSRADRHPALDLSDEGVAGAAAQDLEHILGRDAEPIASKVTRWDGGLPRYEVGHLERIDRIEEAMRSEPRIALAGADYRGPGIPDCIRQASRAAVRLLQELR